MENTIVLPEDTDAADKALDKLLVHPAPAIHLFLFGSAKPINDFAALADSVANGALRKVVRRNHYEDIIKRFTGLPISPGLPPVDSPDVIGFSISGGLVVADVIRAADTLDMLRATDAFIIAEGT